ncbi:MAG: hypothetical protein ABFS46_14115 [Myxococcota bacterium]
MIGSRRRRFWVAALAALLVASASHSATQVASSIPISPTAGASGAVESECQLQTRVPVAISQAAPDVLVVDQPSKSGRWLELEITEVHGPGGGPFSGPKWMAVSGKLHDGGKALGTFRAKRVSTGGFVRGTCATLGRCAQVIGRDIAAWLKAPTMDAELGDAR